MADELTFDPYAIIQIKNSDNKNVFPRTLADAVAYNDNGTKSTVAAKLADLHERLGQAIAGGVTDVKVNGVSVVGDNNVASIPQILSSTEIQGMIDTTVGAQIHMNVQVVEALPSKEDAKKGIIYLMAADKISGNYVEYIWTGSDFEQIGTTATDLQNYAKTADVTEMLKAYAKDADLTALAGRVTTLEGEMDTVEGKVSTLEGEMDTVEGKVSTLEGKVSTLESEMDDVQEFVAGAGNAFAAKEATDAHIADSDIHVTTDDKAEWTGKQNALSEAQMAAVNSGITTELVVKIGANEANFDNYYTKDEADAKFETIENVNAVKEDVAQNAADIKTINESAAMTSGIDATKVAAYEAYATNKADASAVETLKAQVLYFDVISEYPGEQA